MITDYRQIVVNELAKLVLSTNNSESTLTGWCANDDIKLDANLIIALRDIAVMAAREMARLNKERAPWEQPKTK